MKFSISVVFIAVALLYAKAAPVVEIREEIDVDKPLGSPGNYWIRNEGREVDTDGIISNGKGAGPIWIRSETGTLSKEKFARVKGPQSI
ncbi:hypothetical protein GALMADRAFT_263607 [Galerina marginata CBS 339.88]|uniref:Pectate lyase n=1 Tax=Galerina marginata (strain CBS 339.88) TaxID=685588 RepID=A0A067SVE8_GALM3|nr:hypothetical protein GALMADRAFT_249816 [Galerina marginata CBS 339.88]KDR83265.1 hypothetical protein GALMADRAFT_263607 [Galerina marginata CBS 339.88]